MERVLITDAMEGSKQLPQISTHRTRVEMSQSVPSVVDAGTEIALEVSVSCPFDCDLRGSRVLVMDAEGLVMMSQLATYDENKNKTEDLTLRAPLEVGEYVWSVVFPRHETEGAIP